MCFLCSPMSITYEGTVTAGNTVWITGLYTPVLSGRRCGWFIWTLGEWQSLDLFWNKTKKLLKYFRQIITPTLHFNATLNCILQQSAVGGDDINRQLMFLFTCQLRLKNVVTELSFSDIFLTASHFAEKLPSLPMLELCCTQSKESLSFTEWTTTLCEHHMCFHRLQNSLLVAWDHVFCWMCQHLGPQGLEEGPSGSKQGCPALRATQS